MRLHLPFSCIASNERSRKGRNTRKNKAKKEDEREETNKEDERRRGKEQERHETVQEKKKLEKGIMWMVEGTEIAGGDKCQK